MIEDHAHAVQIPTRFAATKLTEKDQITLDALGLDKNEIDACDHIIKELEEDSGSDSEAALADMRFTFIENLCANFVSKPTETIGQRISTKTDRILTGKYTAIPAFLAIMGFIFYITFGPLGTLLTSLMDKVIVLITNIVDSG